MIQADFLQPLPKEWEAGFDTALISANTLFATPQHETLLSQCASALRPGGVLALDVYNALPWHVEYVELTEGQQEDANGEDADGDASLLVRVEDESGREWEVYELDPRVDRAAGSITCIYDFRSGEEIFREHLTHHYLVPEDLVLLLDRCGFEIQELSGDFSGAGFDPEESEHVVVVATKRDVSSR